MYSSLSPGSYLCYEITLQGRLDERWSDWFDDMDISVAEADGLEITHMVGVVLHQARLRGILTKIFDLNLVLISVHMVPSSQ